jgi:MoaD family protein
MLFLAIPNSKKALKYKLLLLFLQMHHLLGNSLNFGLSNFIFGWFAMRVSVRFFTSLREIVGKREDTLEFSDNERVTVDTVLKRLSERYGKDFVEYLYDSKTGDVKGFLQFLINGRSASTLKGLATELSDGDVLAIIPPVGGG